MESETGRIEASIADLLDKQEIREDAEGQAVKELIAEQITGAMKEKGMTKVAVAELMHTTRAQLDRVVEPGNPSVTLTTLQRAAKAVGRNLTITLT
jgi:antitoxin HicB